MMKSGASLSCDVALLGWMDAGKQMSDDEHLLLKAGEEAFFTPRAFVYRFRRPAITTGRHTQIQHIFSHHRTARVKRWVIRRPTGGGAILHAGGICFSYIARRTGSRRIRNASAEWLKENVLKGLSLLGLSRAAETPAQTPQPAGSPHLGRWCAYEADTSDILIGFRKLGGIAQRILKNAILLQGYLMLKKRECVALQKIRLQDNPSKDIVRPISLEEILGSTITPDQVMQTLGHTLQSNHIQ